MPARCAGEVRGIIIKNPPQNPNPLDFSSARTMRDIGRKLLLSIGPGGPDDASIQLAIEANDTFIKRLEQIYRTATGTIEQSDDDD